MVQYIYMAHVMFKTCIYDGFQVSVYMYITIDLKLINNVLLKSVTNVNAKKCIKNTVCDKGIKHTAWYVFCERRWVARIWTSVKFESTRRQGMYRITDNFPPVVFPV